MTVMGINAVAVLVAAVAAFIFGAVYYGIMGKAWMAAQGKTIDPAKKGSPPLAALIASFVGEIAMAVVLGMMIGSPNLVLGMTTGLLAWLGFVMTTLIINHAYQGAKSALTVIDGAHWLGVLLIEGAILGAMG